jgi:hypothetical protein
LFSGEYYSVIFSFHYDVVCHDAWLYNNYCHLVNLSLQTCIVSMFVPEWQEVESEIAGLYATKDLSKCQLAAKFHVSRHSVYTMVWKKFGTIMNKLHSGCLIRPSAVDNWVLFCIAMTILWLSAPKLLWLHCRYVLLLN